MVLAHNIDEGHRTQDVQISHDITFDSMLLAPSTLKGLKNSGFNKPSPIQLLGIPLGKCGFDLILEAKSGTGKTAVFAVIALQKIEMKKGLQVVILTPTREIAAQICDVIKQIGSHYKALQVEVVMGGLPIKEDIAKFKNKKVHVVVGSPGRLRHLIRENHIDTSAVRLLVFDEADKLMDKSFQSDIQHICAALPKQKQVLMSSATYPEDTKLFINQYVRNAQYVCPDNNNILLGIEQKVTVVKYHTNIVRNTKHRFEELLKILKTRQLKQCLIFCNFQGRVSELCKMLKREKWPAEQLHGQQEQTDRLDALKSLQEYKCRILIATDLAARGIDASNVDLVINFEPPLDWQTYLHRIGRAGRFGSYGMAVTLLSEGKEVEKFKEMLGSIKASLNLSNFWNDEMFNIDGSDTSLSSLVSETCTNESPVSDTHIKEILVHGSSVYSDQLVKYGELWNLLNKPIQDAEEVDSFDKLCVSFKESNHSKIESFHDLLSSYQINQYSVNIDDTNNIFKIVEMETPLRANYIKTIQNMTEPIQKVFSQDTVSCKKECSTDITNNKIEANNTNVEDDAVDMNKLCSADIREEDVIDRHNIENEEENITEALIKAGLPTSFSNPRRNQCKSRKHNKRSNRLTSNNSDPFTGENCYNTGYSEKNKTRNKTIDLDAGTSDAYTDLHSVDVLHSFASSKNKNARTKSHETNSQEFRNGEDEYEDCGGYHTLTQEYSSRNVKYTKYENSTRNTKSYYNKDPNNGTCNSKNCYTELECNTPNQTYINWYNHLKYRVKQIEIAAYIEEISRI